MVKKYKIYGTIKIKGVESEIIIYDDQISIFRKLLSNKIKFRTKYCQVQVKYRIFPNANIF